ncbi:MAG: diadenosine tetraphosphate (Ap4A) HIT family hydrolase [Rickettsiales bacterium]|jgi:diadenosine tetraphosphate (Ap4A) HIT family hydrolase
MNNNLEEGFILDQRLENDCFFIKDLKLSKLLLINNKLYPWLILVPKRRGLKEIIDLEFSDQEILLEEINQIGKIIQNIYQPDKLNIANLGNMVSQLHIHIIARYKNDSTFPDPVWINKNKIPYEKNEINKIKRYFKKT